MKTLDIFNAVVDKLDEKFPHTDIYGERQESIDYPAFFIELVPIIHTNETAGRTFKRLSVKINYFTESESNKEYMDMHDSLNELFKLHLPVLNRVFDVFDTTSQVIDGSLYFSFDIEFYEVQTVSEEIPVMEDLFVTTRMEGLSINIIEEA